jgi:hypothetical protein
MSSAGLSPWTFSRPAEDHIFYSYYDISLPERIRYELFFKARQVRWKTKFVGKCRGSERRT